MTGPDSFDGGDAAGSGAGMQLRNAREAAGLSIEEAAQHLKLAPRQVKALEDEEFSLLPGRTFTRGFVRNYARLLSLDADALVSLLPDATRAPGLKSPALHATSTIMGEIPSAGRSKPGSSRWLIPLLLIAVIGAAAGYEWFRSSRLATESRHVEVPAKSSGSTLGSSSQASSGSGGSTGTTPGTPLAGSPSPSAGTGSTATDPVTPAGSSAPGVTATTLPNPLANTPSTTQSGTQSAAQAAAAADPPLVLIYRAAAWTEVRDGAGRVIVARTVPANSVERVNVLPPFELTIGNANMVTVSYRGVPVDIAPYVRQNTARLMLK